MRWRSSVIPPAGNPATGAASGSIGLISSPDRQTLAESLLIGVAAVWGSTFVLVKDAVALYPTLPFLALRFGAATLVLLLPAWLRLRGQGPTSGKELRTGRVLRGGLLMGLLLGAGYIFQTLGLERTSASNAGFITGLFVVLTPLLQALIFKKWIGRGATLGVALALGGLFLLSGGVSLLRGGGGSHLSGDFLVLLCAVSFAGHILATARYAEDEDPIVLTALQLGVVAVLCALLTLAGWLAGVLPQPSWPTDPDVILALAVTALFASALGFYIQTFAQFYASPTRTAVILTMEPVFAGLFAFFLAGERLGAPAWLGAGLILVGMLVSELWPGAQRHWVSAGEGTAWVGEES